jgi:FMN reductase
MKDKIKILGAGGSLEKNSSTFAALKYTTDTAAAMGAEVKLYDLKKMGLPIYSPAKGIEQGGKRLKKFLEDVHSADGYIFASPEYHGTVSGAFKNMLDYFEFLARYKPPYLSNKPAGAIAVGGGDVSGIFTLQTIIHIVHNLRGISASGNAAFYSSQLQMKKNEIKNETVKRRLKRLAEEVYSLAERLK